MTGMIFKEVPNFTLIINSIDELEKQLNSI